MHDSWIDRALLSLVRKMVKPAPVRISLGTPQTEITTLPSSVPTTWIKDRSSLIALLRNPQMNFGDLYSEGRIMVEGDLVGLLESLYRLPSKWPAKLQSRWLTLKQSNSLRGSRRHVRHHYDLSNDFYRLWLDSQMVYTCAYFPQENAGLEEAQRAKLDLVCRKLWLRPGEKVVEAGCGWGALSLHMARHYGVRVKAFNISREQLAFARERAKREGLDGQVEFIEDDYRNVRGQFDAFVSVGMLEHVGKSHHADMGRVIQRSLDRTTSACLTWRTSASTTRARWNSGCMPLSDRMTPWLACSTHALRACGASIWQDRLPASVWAQCNSSRSCSPDANAAICHGRERIFTTKTINP